MWHALLLLGLVGLPSPGQAQYFTEGGGARLPVGQVQNSLENIVDELQLLREAQLREQFPVYDQEIPVQFAENAQQEYTDEEPSPAVNIGQFLGRTNQVQPNSVEEVRAEPVVPRVVPARAEALAITPQKKGQFEFVEFVEPHASKVLKNVEVLEKRAPLAQHQSQGGISNLLGGSSNLLFIAMVTMGCVASVVGVVGGVYYYNTERKRRAEMFDDFTRYSPAGPGRDILRKGRGFAGSPVAEMGDENLAYDAQLHHYQQTKQKIIGDEGNIPDDRSEDEADDLEEHNFSVYECPGLAPTGDIEVQNPNFTQP